MFIYTFGIIANFMRLRVRVWVYFFSSVIGQNYKFFFTKYIALVEIKCGLCVQEFRDMQSVYISIA